MPAIPSLVERVLIRAGILPAFISDIAAAAAFRAFSAGERLGVFEILRGGPRTAAELAEKIGADAGMLAAVCDLLAETGYLARDGDRYRNGPVTERWILSGRGLPDFARHWVGLVFDHWDALEDAVRSGRPSPHLAQYLDGTGRWPIFNAAMAELASRSADEIARAVRLPDGARRLVDVGGSHALNAIAFCRRHPHLQATILDLPQALWAARERIAADRFTSRIEVRAADVTREPLGGPYDAALLFQLLHYFPREQNASLLARVRDALTPGGLVVILDQTGVPPTPLARAFLAAIRVAYRTGLGGDLYAYDEIAGWLRGAGFEEIRRRGVRSAPGNSIITAVKAR
ncbi:MAG TPA: methyltransferase [Candidatus Limnocylindria bacterium]|nr:methyltransferase [Candidatus Limnocylindria bacterium]